MKLKSTLFGAITGLALCWAASAQATVIYVGSWQVDDGPNYRFEDGRYLDDPPPALSGQETAAMLFGGVASDYLISTMSKSVDEIDFMSWVSEIGTGTEVVAQDYVVRTDGLYASVGDSSAYVSDNARGPYYTNFAFRIEADPTEVSEPASVAVLGLGLLGLALVRRNRTRPGSAGLTPASLLAGC